MRNINSAATRAIPRFHNLPCCRPACDQRQCRVVVGRDRHRDDVRAATPRSCDVHVQLAGNHVMNSVLTNLVGHRFGMEPWLVRMPAIVFGVAGVWAFWFVAGRIWERVPALVGTLLLLSPTITSITARTQERLYGVYLFRTRRDGPASAALARAPAVVARNGAVCRVSGRRSVHHAAHAVRRQQVTGLVLIALRRWRLLSLPVVGMAIAAALYSADGAQCDRVLPDSPRRHGLSTVLHAVRAVTGPACAVARPRGHCHDPGRRKDVA